MSQKILSSSNEVNLLKNSIKNSFSAILLKTQNQIDLLKSNFELNHPDKKDKNGFVQISKDNKIISLEDLKISCLQVSNHRRESFFLISSQH